jgi:teichuronic acid biosynthesis glycosyltransferase TuaG
MSQKLVSVVMPMFNSEAHVEQSIASVLSQKYTNLELIICDDGSTDKSLEIVKNFSRLDDRITIISNSHSRGASGARNSCLDIAKGDYIAFLDSDDMWHCNKLLAQTEFMQKNNLNFSYTAYQNIDNSSKLLSFIDIPERFSKALFVNLNFIGCLTVVYDRGVFSHYQQPDIAKRNDYAFWLVLANDPEFRAKGLKTNLASYRVNSYGLSSNKIDAVIYFYKCLVLFGGKNPIFGVFHTIVYIHLSFVKKIFPKFYNMMLNMYNQKN